MIERGDSSAQNVSAFYDQAIRFHQAGRLSEAEQLYRQILAIDPHFAEIQNNLGVALQARGNLDEAVAAYRQAVALKPDMAEVHNNLGNVFLTQTKLDDAVAAYGRALSFRPNYAEAHNNLGFAFQTLGKLNDAAAAYRQAIACKPEYAIAHNNLGNVLMALDRTGEAVAAYETALARDPHYAQAYNNLGLALKTQGKPDEGVAAYERALTLQPGLAEAHNNLGLALQEQGMLDEAITCFKRALACKPGYSDAEMNQVFTQLYRSGAGLSDILACARHWSEMHAAPLRSQWPVHPRSPQPGRRPRIGFISADFRSHAVGFLVAPAIEGLARAGYHLTCYSNHPSTDALTSRFIAAASVWRTVTGLSDDALAGLITSDAIDILIDLSGYSAGNRLLALARKPAPIQVTWVGFPATTGMAAMDYIIADRHQLPEKSERYFTEAVIRLPDSYIVFEPPREMSSGDRASALSQEEVTFGSFNTLKKIGPDVVATWSQILRKLPRSRLLFKAAALDGASARGRYAALFATHGIPEDRLKFIGGTSVAAHREAMHQVDIALDSFPYSGGQTTLEALWAGLPVITQPGETFASLHSLSYLANIGLSELVASSSNHYAELAVDLAGNPERLIKMKSELRSRMLESPLCDVDSFIQNLDAALTTIWHRWCSGQPVAPYSATDA